MAYLDNNGLSHFWEKIKAKFATKLENDSYSLAFVPTKHATTETDFWYSEPAETFTVLNDGWAHYECNNTSSSTKNLYITPKNWSIVKPGEPYTFLIEIKNFSGTTATSGNMAYMQQMNGAQFWGNDVVSGNGGEQHTYIRYGDFVDGAFAKRFVKLADTDHTGDSVGMAFRYRIYLTANTLTSFDIRFSVYPGAYEGEYNEHLSDMIAQRLSVAEDTIDSMSGGGKGVWYAECATAAATAAKEATITPATTEFSLTNGAVVVVKFANTNSAAVADLTLNINGTGAHHIKRYGTTNLAAVGNLTAGQAIQFAYDGSNWLFTGHVDTNTNNYDRRLHNNYIKAVGAVAKGKIACGTSAGYIAVAANASFDIGYPLLWASAAWTSGTQYANGYEAYPGVNPATTGTVQGIAKNAMVYLKGTLVGSTFTCAATNFLTCTIPNSNDGFCYIPLGIVANDATTKMFFNPYNSVYAYVNGRFQRLDSAAIEALNPSANNGIIACFGDSILAGWSNENPSGIDAWNVYLAETLGFQAANSFKIGIGGAGFASGTVFSSMVSTMVTNITNAGKSANDVSLVVIGGGVNDLRNNQPHADIRTGAVNFLTNALNSFPNATIHVFPMIMGNAGCCMNMFEIERDIRMACNDLTTAQAGRVVFHEGCWSWNYDGNDSGVSADRIHLLAGGEKLVGTSMAIEINGGSAYNEGRPFVVADIHGAALTYGVRVGGMVSFRLASNVTTANNNIALGVDKRYGIDNGCFIVSNENQNGTRIFFYNASYEAWTSYSALNNAGCYGHVSYAIESYV